MVRGRAHRPSSAAWAPLGLIAPLGATGRLIRDIALRAFPCPLSQAYAPAAGGAAVLPVWLSDGPYGIHPASIGLLSLQSSVPWAEIKLGMQIRWFQFFTRKRAHRLYPAKYPDPHCQLCTPPQPQEETPGNYFGGCTHPLMHENWGPRELDG